MLRIDKDMKKNLKDTEKDFVKDTSSVPASLIPIGQDRQRFFAKLDKLITALYMVTDIIDRDEPIRHRLRTLGTEIVSDIRRDAALAGNKIVEVVSLLNIASAMNFISEMNCGILRKEFSELNMSIEETKEIKPAWLAEFLNDFGSLENENDSFKGQNLPKGHTRIGVQKGSTLLKALSGVERVQALSDKTYLLAGNNRNVDTANKLGKSGNRHNFDILKNKRRSDILSILKHSGGSATIKDIKTSTIVQGLALHNVSEKTLQRELLSMTKEGILNKTGEKRWSRYFLKS